MDKYDLAVQELRAEAQIVEAIAPLARELAYCNDIERAAFLILQIDSHMTERSLKCGVPIEWFKFREVSDKLYDKFNYVKAVKYKKQWADAIQVRTLAKDIREIHQVRADIAAQPKSNHRLLNKIEKILHEKHKYYEGKETNTRMLFEFFGCSMNMLREYYEKHGVHRMMAMC